MIASVCQPLTSTAAASPVIGVKHAQVNVRPARSPGPLEDLVRKVGPDKASLQLHVASNDFLVELTQSWNVTTREQAPNDALPRVGHLLDREVAVLGLCLDAGLVTVSGDQQLCVYQAALLAGEVRHLGRSTSGTGRGPPLAYSAGSNRRSVGQLAGMQGRPVSTQCRSR